MRPYTNASRREARAISQQEGSGCRPERYIRPELLSETPSRCDVADTNHRYEKPFLDRLSHE